MELGRRSRSLPEGSRCVALSLAALVSVVVVTTAFAATGGLTQKAGVAGCITETGAAGGPPGECADGTAIGAADAIAISANGASVYVALNTADDGGVAILDRNTTTGVLTQKAGVAGCITESGTDITGDGGDCTDGEGLIGALSVAVSPDGTNVYLASQKDVGGGLTDDVVTIFDRNPSGGALTYSGCIGGTTGGPVPGCSVAGPGVRSIGSVMVSPDGKNLYTTSTTSDAVAIFGRSASGDLSYVGCISEGGDDPPLSDLCDEATGLLSPHSVAISPDGKNAYVASASTSDAVTIFDRQGSGLLVQKAGTAGCISEAGSPGTCADGAGLANPESVQVSPDGSSVYVASQTSSAISVFDRNVASGALTQKAGTAACISSTGSEGSCVQGRGLSGAISVAVSSDSRSVYVASFASSAVAVFDRAASGALLQQPGTAGCVSETGSAGVCVDGRGLLTAVGVVTSGDGDNAYVVADAGAVASFDRESGDSPPPGPGPDTELENPEVSLKKKLVVKGKDLKIAITTGCEEICTSVGDGTVVDKPANGTNRSAAAKSKSYVLKPASVKTLAGESAVLQLKLKGSKGKRKKLTKKITRSIKRGNKVKARIEVVLTDEAGNSVTEEPVVKLEAKGKKKG